MTAGAAYAARHVWVGCAEGTDNRWAATCNWTGGTAPVEGGDVVVADATRRRVSRIEGVACEGTHLDLGEVTLSSGVTLEIAQATRARMLKVTGSVRMEATSELLATGLCIGGGKARTTVTKTGAASLTAGRAACQ
jgi:hypothetical protein